jgi:dipeptidyl aminopeptidase/acylaminoacyl peptidase
MRRLADWPHSNAFISKAGEALSWSPDSQRIAFVAAARPKPKPGDNASGDPVVVTRLQYKSRTALADNLHSHIFIVSIDDGKVRQLTDSNFDEHSIAWSPRGDEIAFICNRLPDPDSVLNYDIFTVEVDKGIEHRLTQTPGVEMWPSWSPDGGTLAYAATKRKLTTIDSVAEDAHIFVVDRLTLEAKEISGALDRRAGPPQWFADGNSVYFIAGDQGSTRLYRVGRDGGAVTPLFVEASQLNSFSLAGQQLVYTRSDESAPSELWAAQLDGSNRRALTSLNKAAIAELTLSKPEEIRFKSFDGTDIQGWLVRPTDLQPGKKCPMILSIHGGPHGMFGNGFNLQNQIWAALGYAVLYINPRGSSGYGQKFSDGCVGEWGGGDYQDLMKGVDVALAKYTFLDANRLGVTGGSYGGFMTNWVISQTDRFKAAVAVASVSNLISFYATSLYQDLVHAEFKGYPWDNYELLWKYSPIHYVKSVTTPTMFIHGEQDNDVHITQAEEMYTAMRRHSIDAVLVRYPREGHGLREPLHRLDESQRVLAWFDRYIKPNVE